jgi:hypothetical protein
MHTFTKGTFARHLVVGLVGLLMIGSVAAGCGSSDSSDDETPTPSTEVVVDSTATPVTSGDQAVDEVESDLASLDADLQVIDEALAELDSLDSIAP